MRKRPLLLLFSVVFMDMVGFGFILPLLPFYASSFGGTPAVSGLLLASYALGQLFGAPAAGRLSDRYGRKPLLLLSIGGTFASLLLLGFARSLWMLFLSRFLDGITGGNITVAQAYITDSSTEENRAKSLGMIGAAFGLGFIFGPIIGGVLSTWGYAVPSFAAAGVSAINLLLITFLLPESLDPEKRKILAQSPRTAFSLKLLWKALHKPCVGPIYHVLFTYGIAFAVFTSIYSLFVQYRLGYDARTTGFTLAYVGVLVAAVQGGIVGPLVKRFDEKTLIRSSAFLMIPGFAIWAFTPNTIVLLIVLIPLALGAGVLNTVLRSRLTKSVAPEEIGGALGLTSAIDGLNRIIAPAIGGVLIGRVSVWSPGVAAAVLMLWTTVFVFRKFGAGRREDPVVEAAV